MKSSRLLLAALFLATILTAPSLGWADPPDRSRQGKADWEDRDDQTYPDHPPGWDKGKKTGWQGYDQPPGQRKKYRYRYDRESGWNQNPSRKVIPVPVPVPVPR